MAAMCKENGLLLFLYLLVVECFIYRWSVMNARIRQCLNTFFMATIALPLCLVLYMILQGDPLINYETKSFNLQQRLLTEVRVIWFYIGQILLPQTHSFNLYHDDFSLSTSLWEPLTTLTSTVGLIFILAVGIKYARRFPWLGFGIVFFLSGHVMESTIFPLILVFEHRNYLPSLGLILILVLFIKIILGFSKRISSNLILVVLMILFASVTASRAYDWHSIPLLAERLVQRNPNSVTAHYEVGYTYMKLYEIDHNPVFSKESTKAFQRAYMHASGNKKLKIAIVRVHVASLYGEPQDQALLDEINMAVRNSRVGTEEVLALKGFVKCKTEDICDTEHGIYKKIFTNLLSNPGLREGLHDDVLYIYSSYLVKVLGEEEQALKFMREIVARNPENMTYKVKLISVLLTNEYMTEAYQIMDNLTEQYGTEWNIVKEE
jgi:hypothetical protein